MRAAALPEHFDYIRVGTISRMARNCAGVRLPVARSQLKIEGKARATQ